MSFVLQRHVATRGAFLLVRPEPEPPLRGSEAGPEAEEGESSPSSGLAKLKREIESEEEAAAAEAEEEEEGEEEEGEEEEGEEEELCVAFGLAAFEGEVDSELSFDAAERLLLLVGRDAPRGWWLALASDGACGLVPQSYVEPRPELPTGAGPTAGAAPHGGGSAMASPQAPKGMSNAVRAGADCIQGLRYSLELSPVAERPEPAAGGAAGGAAGARNSLAASGLWEGGWSRPEATESIFDERRHPLYPEHARPSGEPWPVPSVRNVCSFVTTLSTTARMGSEASVCGLAYIERFLAATASHLEPHSWRRLTLVAWLVANKMWDDDGIENLELAEVAS